MNDIETQVCADIKARQERGIAKYGLTVAQNPLSLHEWLQHAYEECLDQAVYLKRAMEELEAQNAIHAQQLADALEAAAANYEES